MRQHGFAATATDVLSPPPPFLPDNGIREFFINCLLTPPPPQLSFVQISCLATGCNQTSLRIRHQSLPQPSYHPRPACYCQVSHF